MDPLSIIASSLTLIAAVNATTKKLKSIKDANEDLRRLIDDLTDFEIILRQTKSLIETHLATIPRDQLADLSALLERATSKLVELELLHQKVLQKGSEDAPKASKISWAIWSSRIAALQNSLQSNKQSLSLLLTCMTTSCSLQLFSTITEISRDYVSLHGRQTRIQQSALHNVKKQGVSQRQILGKLARIELSNNQLCAVQPVPGRWSASFPEQCKRCEFLRVRSIAYACLSCSRLLLNTNRWEQPQYRISLLDKRALIEDLRLGEEYQYLEDIIVSWESDTASAFIKALPYENCPSLEVRVKRFKPSRLWQPLVEGRIFDDEKGWLVSPPIMTKPHAIPYTHYVESGRLKTFARESYRWKLRNQAYVPGRSLLSAVGLADTTVIEQHRLFKDAFTFAGLSWLAMSILYATDVNPQYVYDRFGDEEFSNISVCPTAINSQIRLLCHELARELETDILGAIDELIFKSKAARTDLEIVFVVYASFTVMMDAYECLALIFESYSGDEIQRCLHLVESIAAELRNLLHGPSMAGFLTHAETVQIPDTISSFAEKVKSSASEEKTRDFFEKYSWEAAKASDFTEFNFAFQSLLQGYGGP